MSKAHSFSDNFNVWKGNIDPRKQPGQGRDTKDGFITFGTQVIDQRQLTVKAADYLTSFPTWLAVQNGRDDRGQDQFEPQRRFIRNLRDGANYVHFDYVVNPWWSAAFLLLSEPRGKQHMGSSAGRPQVDMAFAFDMGDPYDPPGTAGDSRTQTGFATFGPIHLFQLLIEVAGRAGRAVWWQKAAAARGVRRARGQPPQQPAVLSAPRLRGEFPVLGAARLKAFFDESAPIENPVMASADGLSLVSYSGADAAQMTVGGELDKLAGNIALFRSAAGVHWRSDYTESLTLGEQVAIGLLQEMTLTFNEDDAFFQLTRFDGTTLPSGACQGLKRSTEERRVIPLSPPEMSTLPEDSTAAVWKLRALA
jgi:hypothetical protein